MADITKCKGDNCPLKNECYRYLVETKDHWQSWFNSVPYNEEEKKCPYFWILPRSFEKKED